MRRDRILRALVRHPFIVTMTDGQTWRGVVMDADDRTVVLRQAEAVGRDGDAVEADGEVLLPRHAIAYMQTP